MNLHLSGRNQNINKNKPIRNDPDPSRSGFPPSYRTPLYPTSRMSPNVPRRIFPGASSIRGSPAPYSRMYRRGNPSTMPILGSNPMNLYRTQKSHPMMQNLPSQQNPSLNSQFLKFKRLPGSNLNPQNTSKMLQSSLKTFPNLKKAAPNLMQQKLPDSTIPFNLGSPPKHIRSLRGFSEIDRNSPPFSGRSKPIGLSRSASDSSYLSFQAFGTNNRVPHEISRGSTSLMEELQLTDLSCFQKPARKNSQTAEEMLSNPFEIAQKANYQEEIDPLKSQRERMDSLWPSKLIQNDLGLRQKNAFQNLRGNLANLSSDDFTKKAFESIESQSKIFSEETDKKDKFDGRKKENKKMKGAGKGKRLRGVTSRFFKGKERNRVRLNKKFSSLSKEDLTKRKEKLEKDLGNLKKDSGKLLKKIDLEILPKQNLWAKTVVEAKEHQKRFFGNLEERRRQLKRVGKSIENYKKIKIKKKKKVVQNKDKNKRKKAKEICTLVNRGFWNKIRKLKQIKSNWQEEEKRRNVFKERLDSFVEQSANLTSHVAEKLRVDNKTVPIENPTIKKDDQKQDEKQKTIEEKIKERTEKNINPKTPSGNTIKSCPVKTPIPPLLRHGSLRDYQRIGLDWLVTLHESKMNGILADEMGLGKTIQTISLLAHLASKEENWGPHLLIVPTSVIVNWEMEFKRWLPGFKVLAYYGSAKERKVKRKNYEQSNSFHVLVTSYHLAVNDNKFLKRRNWEYLVLDEAHNIKNFQSKKWQTIMGFKTTHRLLLTGTPLQNNIMELWSFLHFLMPTAFASRLEFTQWFDCPMADLAKKNSSLSNAPVVLSLHSVLRPFMLRRLKKDVATQLPKKREMVVKCRLSIRQRRLYDEFMAETKTKDILQRENLVGMWSVLMQLRKVCNHPDLFEARPILSPLRLPALQAKRPPAFFAALLGLEREPFDRVCLSWLFPGVNGDLNDDLYNGMAESSFSGESLSKLAVDEKNVMDLYLERRDVDRGHTSGGSEAELVGLLEDEEYRKGLVWIKDDLDAEKIVKKEKLKYLEKTGSIKAQQNRKKCNKNIVFAENIIRILFIGRRMLENRKRSETLKQIVKLPKDRAKLMKKEIEDFVVVSSPAVAVSMDADNDPETISNINRKRACSKARSHPPVRKRVRTFKLGAVGMTNKDDAQNETLSTKLNRLIEPFHLANVRSSMNFPDKRLIQWDCGKLQKLSSMLTTHKKQGDRVLIFTQMSKMLNILEAFMNIYGYRYFRLDGTTKTDRRGIMMERFNTDPSIFAFILTTRSGGYGINLTGANVVIFYDTDWNPSIDLQAQDRAHRIGQTREVTIYRLISTNTVEENMFQVSLNKRKVTAAVIGDGNFNTKNLVKRSDIRQMFGITKQEDIKDDIKREDSEENLEKMMEAAEDAEDQKSLKKAMNEIKETSFTAEEHTAQMEAELNGIERYALNYESNWLCISGIEQLSSKPTKKSTKKKSEGESEDEFSGEKSQSESESDSLSDDIGKHEREKNEIKKDKHEIKKDIGKKRKFGADIKTKKDSKDERGIEVLLEKKFAALTGEERNRVILHYKKLFSCQGFYVHEKVFDPLEQTAESLYGNFSEVTLTTEQFLSNKDEFDSSINKGQIEINQDDKQLLNDKLENGNSEGLENDSFYLEDYALETHSFQTLFPIEANLLKLESEISVKRNYELDQGLEGINYVWNSCPPQPELERGAEVNRLVKVEAKKTIPLQATLIANRKKTNNQKRSSRRTTNGTTQRVRRPAIFVRQVLIKIPFKFLRTKFPRGWESIRFRRIGYSNEGPLSEKKKKSISEVFALMQKNALQKDLEHKVPILWTHEEDQVLLNVSKRFDQNWAIIEYYLCHHPTFSGHLRSSTECRSRFLFLYEFTLPQKHRTSEGLKAIKIYEMRQSHLQATMKASAEKNGPLKDFQSVVNHYPVALGTPEMGRHFKSAVEAVKSHRKACANALTATLKVGVASERGEELHSSHNQLSTEGRRSLGLASSEKVQLLRKIADLAFKKTIACKLEMSKKMYDGKDLEQSYNKNNRDFQSEMKNIAMILYQDPQWALKITKNKSAVQNFINYVVSTVPEIKVSLKQLCDENAPNQEKIKTISSIFLKSLARKNSQ